MHEAPRQNDTPKLGSNRSFGLVFAGVFAVITAYIFIRHDRFSIPAAAVSAVFLVCALLVPQILTPLNKLWFRFGLLLHKIVSPVILGMIFFVILTPAGFLLRRFSRKDEAAAQWIDRAADDVKAGSFRNQF
ncbi:SxtJ family membrane protein [Taklimakanibacter lacteus]|uniref:SxtJ family membrane protein n=1 Tax=Taklimakanibacter lacteus TaxID=2268456 RepID=UPI000E666042